MSDVLRIVEKDPGEDGHTQTLRWYTRDEWKRSPEGQAEFSDLVDSLYGTA